MSGETYQVFKGEECVASKLKESDATKEYWQLCSSHPDQPIYLAKVQVLATNSVAQAALTQVNQKV
jgi:hypothetical protein